MSAAKLKPCPFCGGDGFLFTATVPSDYDCQDIYVQCMSCSAIGPSEMFDQDTHAASEIPDLEKDAIAAWNTRTEGCHD